MTEDSAVRVRQITEDTMTIIRRYRRGEYTKLELEVLLMQMGWPDTYINKLLARAAKEEVKRG